MAEVRDLSSSAIFPKGVKLDSPYFIETVWLDMIVPVDSKTGCPIGNVTFEPRCRNNLRYYERIGLIPSVNRNSTGIRNYTEDDCNWVQFIKCMRSAGLSIEVLVEYVSLFQQGNSTIKVRKELLIEQRKQLVNRIADMQEILERLDKKIDGYEERVLFKEEELRK